MIIVDSKNDKVAIEFSNVPPALFDTLVAHMKIIGGKYRNRAWLIPVHKYDAVKGELEELDLVIERNPLSLQKLRDGEPELVIASERANVDYNLVTCKPFIGKYPNEKFQSQAVLQGLQKNRYGFFLGQGSGKSYIAAVIIAHRFIRDKEVDKILLLSTPIGTRNLYSELKHFIPNLPLDRIVIATRDKWEVFTDDYDIVIASYDSFRTICNRYRKKFKIKSKIPSKPFLPLKEWGSTRMMMLDESHSAANSQSQQGHLVALHSPLFFYRYLFTGTPADKPEKLYNQLKILDPSLTHKLNYTDWLDKYAYLGNRYSKYAVNEWKHEEFEKLNQKIVPMYATFLKSEELLDLPPHFIKKINIDMSPKHRELYEVFLENEISSMVRERKSSVRDLVNRFPYMMLAVDNPELLYTHEHKFNDKVKKALYAVKNKDQERIQAVKDILESHEGEKGILWVIHPKTATLYNEIFSSYHPIVITGETPEEQRKTLLDTYKTDQRNKILIANIDVLSTSVTITSASFQVYIERSFSYVPYEQSIKRIYRIGQNKTVTTYVLLYNNSLDIIRDKNLDDKGMLVEGLLSKDFLTQEEWKGIFNGDMDLLPQY